MKTMTAITTTLVACFISAGFSSAQAIPLNVGYNGVLAELSGDVVKAKSRKLRYKNGRRYVQKSRRKNKLHRRALRRNDSVEFYGLRDDGYYRRLRQNYDIYNDQHFRDSSSGGYYPRN